MSRIPISFTLLLALAGFLAWASLFEVDQTVRARGTVIVQGHAQVIQSPEGGVLRELRVQEGDRVAKDQVLAVMDQQAVRAAVDEISAEIETNIIARLRATAELAGRRPDFGGLAKTYPQVALAQMALFDGNMAALQEEKGFAEAQLQVATDQLAQLRTLVIAGNASSAEVARAQREVLQIQGMITAIVERYRGQARKDIAEIEQQISTLEFRLAGRRTSLAFAELRAPQHGIVTKLQTNTLGAVLRPGDELMRLSPTGGKHLVEVQIAPADVGALQIGHRRRGRGGCCEGHPCRNADHNPAAGALPRHTALVADRHRADRHRRHHPRPARRLETGPTVIGWLLIHGPARKALGLILTAAAILLFLLNLRRAGERAGRAAERFDARERNDAVYRQMLDAAARRPPNRDALAERLRDGRF